MNKYAIIISSFMLLLSSCMSMREISFDYLTPAEISFPEQIKSVAVISTIPQNNLDNITFKSSQTIVGDQKISKEILAKRIADTHYFENVIVSDSVVTDKFDLVNYNYLSSNAVSDMLFDFNSDMLISLDKMNMKIEKLNTSQLNYPIDIIRFVTNPEIKFYVSNRKSPIFTVALNDTAYYHAYDLAEYNTVFQYAYEDAIQKVVDMVLPHWKSSVRHYYTGGTYEMRDAEVAILEDDWDGAYELWNSVYKNRGAKLRNYAAFNIALYYELKDNIPESMKWLDLVLQKCKTNSELFILSMKYKHILSQRENEISKLKLQMNRFN